jgi:hypothetical protein
MKCPHCGISVASHGAEVLKCWECGRWIDVVWIKETRTTCGFFQGFKYMRPVDSWRGGYSTRPTQVELLVELCRSHGFQIPFRKWDFERLRPGYWQRSSGAWSWRITWKGSECGSPDSVAACLRAGKLADISV